MALDSSLLVAAMLKQQLVDLYSSVAAMLMHLAFFILVHWSLAGADEGGLHNGRRGVSDKNCEAKIFNSSEPVMLMKKATVRMLHHSFVMRDVF